MTLSAPLLLVVVAVALSLLAVTRRLPAGRWLAVAVFSVYLVGVANFVLLPLTFDPRAADKFGPIDIGRLIEFRPFFLPSVNAMPLSQALLNVLLTVPFGFGLPFVMPVRRRAVLVLGVLLSIGIELLQLTADALYLALPTWSIDINDVFLNSLGAAIGYLLYRGTSLIYAGTAGRLRIRKGPWAHFHDAMTRPDR